MIIPGTTIWSSEDTSAHRTVITTQEIRLDEGEFVVESHFGYRTIGRLTGRTRQFWGIACPTIERFEIETVVIDGAIWGVRGEAIAGTFAVRPERIQPSPTNRPWDHPVFGNMPHTQKALRR